MKTYKLVKYYWTDTMEVLEDKDIKLVEEQALTQSRKEKEMMYRIDPYENGKRVSGLRYFQNGVELTRSIQRSILNSIIKDHSA